jgi:hypothetical protein
MAEIASETTFSDSSEAISSAQASVIASVAEYLDTETLSGLDIYEGETTGVLYAATESGYQRAEVGPSGLDVTADVSPTETLVPVARIEPDPGETISDAADSLSFAGD